MSSIRLNKLDTEVAVISIRWDEGRLCKQTSPENKGMLFDFKASQLL
jgi:uncharacterized membrane protein (UPF0127 family)